MLDRHDDRVVALPDVEDAVDLVAVDDGYIAARPQDRDVVADVEVPQGGVLIAARQGQPVGPRRQQDRVGARVAARALVLGHVHVGGPDRLSQRAVAVARGVVDDRRHLDGGGCGRGGAAWRQRGREQQDPVETGHPDRGTHFFPGLHLDLLAARRHSAPAHGPRNRPLNGATRERSPWRPPRECCGQPSLVRGGKTITKPRHERAGTDTGPIRLESDASCQKCFEPAPTS